MIWDIDPIAFHLGSRPIRYYGLFFMLALFISYFALGYMARKYSKRQFNVDVLFIFGVPILFFGGRLFHLVFYQWDDFSHDPGMLFDFSRGGLASHGVLFMVFVYTFVFCRLQKIPFAHFADLVSVFVAYSASCIRFGNFFNSEIIGRATNVPWAVTFKRVDMIPRHPVQLYEAALLIATSSLMLWGAKKRGWLEHEGRCTGVFLAMYFGGRCFLEFTKELQVPAAEQWMTMGQWLSIAPALIGAWLVWRARSSVA